MNALSTIPSEILTQALEDYAVMKDRPGYVIDMGTYYRPQEDGIHICLASCVMINRLGAVGYCDRCDYPESQRLYFITTISLGHNIDTCLRCALNIITDTLIVPKKDDFVDYINDVITALKEIKL
jgi:hypothetical protein